MTRIRKVETLKPEWVYELYIIGETTMRYDAKRRCWICGGEFKIGQGMTILGATTRGNKPVHTSCYVDQTGLQPERIKA